MLISKSFLQDSIWIAGLGQLALIVGSLAIPRLLHWKEELSRVSTPLIRQIFWVYSVYIWATNLSFGLLSAFAPDWLLAKTPLAGAVAGFIALYWISRFLIQIFYFDRSDVPQKPFFKLAEAALTGLFIFLSIVYSLTMYFNFH
jgi:hypothetical protein